MKQEEKMQEKEEGTRMIPSRSYDCGNTHLSMRWHAIIAARGNLTSSRYTHLVHFDLKHQPKLHLPLRRPGMAQRLRFYELYRVEILNDNSPVHVCGTHARVATGYGHLGSLPAGHTETQLRLTMKILIPNSHVSVPNPNSHCTRIHPISHLSYLTLLYFFCVPGTTVYHYIHTTYSTVLVYRVSM